MSISELVHGIDIHNNYSNNLAVIIPICTFLAIGLVLILISLGLAIFNMKKFVAPLKNYAMILFYIFAIMFFLSMIVLITALFIQLIKTQHEW